MIWKLTAIWLALQVPLGIVVGTAIKGRSIMYPMPQGSIEHQYDEPEYPATSQAIEIASLYLFTALSVVGAALLVIL
jgi:hypothetical protein